jgi:hypothetical protein
MNENAQIERGTAEKFLQLYNQQMGASYTIVCHSDSPDFQCRDHTTGEQLGLEVTNLEDVSGDLQYILGRGQGQGTRCFNEDTLERFRRRIAEKCRKDYGPNAALVLRQVTILWSDDDWEMYREDFQAVITEECKKTYSKGIWVLTWEETPVRSENAIVRLM